MRSFIISKLLPLACFLAGAAILPAQETNEVTHRLEAHDSVSFRIVEDTVDPQESGEPKILTVNDSGDLDLPYLNHFAVAGKTCEEAAADIKAALERKFYYQATVLMAVELKAKSVGTCYISGQVHQTGALEMPGDVKLTLSQAVVRAQGFTEFADKKHVRLTRRLPSGKNDVRRVNLQDVLEKGKADQDIQLEPGDSIFVPSRMINF